MAASCSSILPKGWPIRGLTLPRGVKAAEMPELLGTMNSLLGLGTGRRDWVVAFNYSKGWDALAAHVDRKMRRLGYSAEDPLGDAAKLFGGAQSPPYPGMMPSLTSFMRMYSSADKPYTVTLLNSTIFKAMSSKPEGEVASFVLMVAETGPRPSRSKSSQV